MRVWSGWLKWSVCLELDVCAESTTILILRHIGTVDIERRCATPSGEMTRVQRDVRASPGARGMEQVVACGVLTVMRRNIVVLESVHVSLPIVIGASCSVSVSTLR